MQSEGRRNDLDGPERQFVVHIHPSILAHAQSKGIDVDEFYMREYGAKVEVMKELPR